MQYLLSVLQDPALDLIKTLPISPANYNIAWWSLMKRYRNERLLASLHIKAILDLASFSKPSSHTLRNFISILNENMQALSALQYKLKDDPLSTK